ncbi:hypothetical protein FSP39_018349 [Pinctada imbricata]|uniref:Nucleoside diphosphate kinase-like domain-containing protein n=1 Tax=Pinctada imbricata TaxID=66713 RepID=A0AA88YU91_PINIB|nr:hypothetical protein FSP39_018349 [Pinctada imbricata]
MMDSSDEGSDNELFVPRSSRQTRNVAEEFPIPEHSQLKPKLDSIFAEVEKNLPSIDFDLSDVSSDNDEPQIFNRPLKATTFDDDKDLDTSLNSETLSGLLPPGIESTWTEQRASTSSTDPYDNDAAAKKQSKGKGLVSRGTSSWTEFVVETREDKSKFPERPQPVKVQNWMESADDALSMIEKELTTHPTRVDSSQQTTQTDDTEKYESEETAEGPKKSSSHSSTGDFDTDDKRMNQQVMKEEQRRNEQDIVTNMVSPTAPRLLSSVNALNIDLVLHSLNEENFSVPAIIREAWAQQQRRIETIYAAGEGCNRMVEQNSSEEKKSTSSCGTNTTDAQPMKVLTPRPWKSVTEPVEEPKPSVRPGDTSATVFIDLRNFDEKNKEKQQNIERVKQILNIDQESSSDDSDSEQDMGLWFEQRRKMKQQLAARTGTETKLTKPKSLSAEGFKKPPRVIHLPEKDNKQRDNDGEITEDMDEAERLAIEERRKAREAEREKIRKMEETRKLREEREAERQSRLRLAKRLEALRPSASVGGKQDCAEATPVVFDLEASYEPAPHTLPVTLRPDIEVLLLTVHLSSNGEIILHRGKTNKSVDTGNTYLHMYEMCGVDTGNSYLYMYEMCGVDAGNSYLYMYEMCGVDTGNSYLHMYEMCGVDTGNSYLHMYEMCDVDTGKSFLHMYEMCDVDTSNSYLYMYEMCDVDTGNSFLHMYEMCGVDTGNSYLHMYEMCGVDTGNSYLHMFEMCDVDTGNSYLYMYEMCGVDTGVGLSASYTVLVTWLLSLVPDNFDFFLPNGSSSKPGQTMFYDSPFHVIGLQQLWMDEHLNLVVAITPTKEFDAKYVPNKSKKSKLKDEVKDSSPFHQLVSKFLSTNTLHSVCPWLQDLVSVEVPGESSGYTYRPPLPNITTKPLSTFIQIKPDQSAASKVFNSAVGFFWQTVDNDEALFEQTLNDSAVLYDTQITMSLVYKKIFRDSRSMMGIFNRVLQEGLDLAGIRLVYPGKPLISLASGNSYVPNQNQNAQSENEILNKIGPVLSIALRGTFARSIWLDAVGPSDPVLARRTDPNSLCALYGGDSRDECLLFCPRNPSRIQTELSRWFGARVPPGGVIDVGTPYTRKDHSRSGSPNRRKSKRVTFSEDLDLDKNVSLQHRPAASLSATTKSGIFLVLSPLMPPKCFGIVMATCQRRGYQVRGIRRQRLTSKKAGCLGVSSSQLSAFCPTHSDSSDLDLRPSSHGCDPTSPCTVLLLEKENATHSAASLIEACMIQLTLSGTMAKIQLSCNFDVQSGHLLHAARYSDSLLTNLGGDFTKCIDHEIQVNPSFIIPKLYTNPEVEQVVVLLMLGHDILKSSGLFVGKLLNAVPYGKTAPVLLLKEGFELLGIKWVATLTKSQAKEVNPYELGDKLWKDAIHTLTTEPALVLALRSVDGFRKLQSIIPSIDTSKKSGHIDYIMSSNAEEAYAFTRAFFTDRELFSDPKARTLSAYMPSDNVNVDPSGKQSSHKEDISRDSIFHFMLRGPRPITTLLVIKPRALKKHLPKLLRKISQEGFKVVGLKLQVLDQAEARKLVPAEARGDEALVKQHVDYLVSGPSLSLVLCRENAVRKLLDLLGPQDPLSARRQNQFLWRGTFGVDSVVNGLHGSIDYVSSIEEQKSFFPCGLCCKPTDDLIVEKIESPAVDSQIDTGFHDNRSVNLHQLTDNQQEVLEHHLLMQTTCVILKPPLVTVQDKGQYPYVELIEGMLKQGFEITGARMVWLTQEQAQVYLHIVNAGSFRDVPLLTSGPCIVLALQRDNAVLAFESIMGSDYGSESLIGRYGALIGRPADIQEVFNFKKKFTAMTGLLHDRPFQTSLGKTNEGGDLQQHQAAAPTAKPQNIQCKNTEQTSTGRDAKGTRNVNAQHSSKHQTQRTTHKPTRPMGTRCRLRTAICHGNSRRYGYPGLRAHNPPTFPIT